MTINSAHFRYRCKATNPHGEAHQDYYVEVFENEDQFYGIDEQEIINIGDVTDDVTTGFGQETKRSTEITRGTTQEPTTTGYQATQTETEGTEAEGGDATTPYYMKYF